MDQLLIKLAENGFMGIVIAILFWFCYHLVKKLYELIESNTETISVFNKTQEQVIKVIEKNTEMIGESIKFEQEHRSQAERTHNEVHKINLNVIDVQESVSEMAGKLKDVERRIEDR